MCVWTKKRGSMNCRLNVLHVVPINARIGNSIETETPPETVPPNGHGRK